MQRISLMILTAMLANTALAQTPPAVQLPAVDAAAAPVVQLPDVQATPAATNPPAVPALASTNPSGAALVPAVPALPGTTASAEAALPAAAEGFSFGDAPYSVLFTPAQADSIRKALTTYETIRRTGQSSGGDLVIEEEVPSAPIAEPAVYPTMHLASIAYRNPADWTVWINRERITPSSNDGALRVVRLGPTQAQFAWKPPFGDSFRTRSELNLFAPTSTVAHKATHPNNALYDPVTEQVFFTLKPNQSFASGYMATFEGNMAPPKLDPLPSVAGTTADTATAGTSNPTDADKILNEGGVGGDAIRRMYDKASGSTPSASGTSSVDDVLRSQQEAQGAAPTQTISLPSESLREVQQMTQPSAPAATPAPAASKPVAPVAGNLPALPSSN